MSGIDAAPAPYDPTFFGLVEWNVGVCPRTINGAALCSFAVATIASSRVQS